MGIKNLTDSKKLNRMSEHNQKFIIGGALLFALLLLFFTMSGSSRESKPEERKGESFIGAVGGGCWKRM